ncbi:MAG: hypothetical protein HY901_09340, partial [Deltaproteobacteria bacterium]|nr:hypothetical protein [Deltaproteobacteria bacterium]
MQPRPLLVLLALLVTSTACTTGVPGMTCTHNSDCGLEETCQAGLCVIVRRCDTDLDCPVGASCSGATGTCVACPACEPGEVCLSGACLPTSCADRRCPTGQVCSDGACRTPDCLGVICAGEQTCARGTCLPTGCSPSQPCHAGEVCSEGRCLDPACVGVTCAEGEGCAGGRCSPRECADRSCADGALCESGRCRSARCLGVECLGGALCGDGQCLPIACAEGAQIVSCAPGRACLEGRCGDPDCAGASCPEASLCVAGSCLPVACPSQPCGAGSVCAEGSCRPASCVGVTCPAETACASGQCVPTACGGVQCPLGRACINDVCVELACAGVQCADPLVCRHGLCLRPEELPTGECVSQDGSFASGEGGCKDLVSGLVWSSVSQTTMAWGAAMWDAHTPGSPPRDPGDMGRTNDYPEDDATLAALTTTFWRDDHPDAYCHVLVEGQRSDWRVPSLTELQSLREHLAGKDAAAYLKGVASGGAVWSSALKSIYNAWLLRLDTLEVTDDIRQANQGRVHQAICVRGGRKPSDHLAIVSAPTTAGVDTLRTRPIVLQVADPDGRPVYAGGLTLTFTTDDGATLAPSTATTDTFGQAALADWSIVAAPGPSTIKVSAPDLQPAELSLRVGEFPHTCAEEDEHFATTAGGCKDLASGLVWSAPSHSKLTWHEAIWDSVTPEGN